MAILSHGIFAQARVPVCMYCCMLSLSFSFLVTFCFFFVVYYHDCRYFSASTLAKYYKYVYDPHKILHFMNNFKRSFTFSLSLPLYPSICLSLYIIHLLLWLVDPVRVRVWFSVGNIFSNCANMWIFYSWLLCSKMLSIFQLNLTFFRSLYWTMLHFMCIGFGNSSTRRARLAESVKSYQSY